MFWSTNEKNNFSVTHFYLKAGLTLTVLAHLLTGGGFFLISKFLVSPKDIEAMVGSGPRLNSSSECQGTWSCPSLYRLANTELNWQPVTSSKWSFMRLRVGVHC